MPGFRGVRRGTTTARGYGQQHTKARAAAFARLPEVSPCCRCGKPMFKWAKDKHGKSALHYDHNAARTGYLGFAHALCNRRAGAAAGQAAARRIPRKNKDAAPHTWTSRAW